jgi:hypothetical protein
MNYPTITLDRGKAIADAAVDASLAHWEHGENDDRALRLESVMRAELARCGVGNILALSVDQAEQIEAFVGAYAQGRQYAVTS